MTNKKLKVNRNRYDFGGGVGNIPADLLNYSQRQQEGSNDYMDQIVNPEAQVQQGLMNYEIDKAARENSGLSKALGTIGNLAVNNGIGIMTQGIASKIKGIGSKGAADATKGDSAPANGAAVSTPTFNLNRKGKPKRDYTEVKKGLAEFGMNFGKNILSGIVSLFAEGGVAGEEQNVQHIPIEAEGGEMIAMPWDNHAMPIEGASHENGGVDMTVPVGSKIYSKRVKDAKGKSMAYRKERRDRELKKWEKIVKDDPNNKIAKDTLEKVRRNNEIEEANDMAYMQLHKAKKQFSDYIKDVAKDYGKGGGLNIAMVRQAIDQHTTVPVKAGREQYFTGAYVKPPNIGFLGKWNVLQPNEQPLTIDTVKRYISSKLPAFKFNGLINSEPTQGALTPEQQKYFFEEIAPYLDYHAYMNDPSKIIADGKTRHKGSGNYQAKNFNYGKYKHAVDNAFKGLDPNKFQDNTQLGRGSDISLIISDRFKKLQELGQLNILNAKQVNLPQSQNLDWGKSQKDTQDNVDTPWEITQSQENLASLGISNIPYINKSNITRPTGNYQALQYNQAKYNKTLQDAFTGVDTNQFTDSTGSSTNSDIPPTIRQAQQNLANLGQLKSDWYIKPPADNQVGNTSTDTKATATKQAQDSIGQSYRPAPQVDIETLAALISNNDPRAFALLQNINNNTQPKPTAKGKQSNRGNATTQVPQHQITQYDIEELRNRLPKTINMNGRSYNTDALLDQLNQNPLARLALGQSIFSNDVTTKQSGKSTNKGQQSTKKSQGKDISNVNPNDIDKLIQSGWNPLFALTAGLPTTVNNNTVNTANTGNQVVANNTYNPNNFSYSPDYMAQLFGLKKDATTGEYYDPKTIQQAHASVAGDNTTSQSQQNNIGSTESNTTSQQNTTTDNTGTTPNTLAQPGVTAIDYNSRIQDAKKFYSGIGNLAHDIFIDGSGNNADYSLSDKENNYVNALKIKIGVAIDTAKQNNYSPDQLQNNIIKILSKDPLFEGQKFGEDNALTRSVKSVMGYMGITENNNKQDNKTQSDKTVQDNKTVQNNNSILNYPLGNNDETTAYNNPYLKVLPPTFNLKKDKDGNVTNLDDLKKQLKEGREDIKKQLDGIDYTTGLDGDKTPEDKKVEQKKGEDKKVEGDDTTQKASLWSILGESLNPSFGVQLAGILHNMIKPKQAAEDNFKAKQRYKNNYRDYGKKSLLELDKMKDNLQAMMDQNLRELENQRTAQTYINNNSARDINVARALNLAALSKTMDATNRVYANQAALQNNIHQVRANMLSNIDHRVMGEDRNTQTLNNQLIDSYFNNKATADMIFGTGLQNIGKLFDNRQFINELRKMYKERSSGLGSKYNKNKTRREPTIAIKAGEKAEAAKNKGASTKTSKPTNKGAVPN